MCIECYREYGEPKIATEQVMRAATLIARVYGLDGPCSVGGWLHIAIDDWNLEDSSIDICQQAVERHIAQEGETESLRAQRKCIQALKDLSIDERAAALGLYYKFWQNNSIPG